MDRSRHNWVYYILGGLFRFDVHWSIFKLVSRLPWFWGTSIGNSPSNCCRWFCVLQNCRRHVSTSLPKIKLQKSGPLGHGFGIRFRFNKLSDWLIPERFLSSASFGERFTDALLCGAIDRNGRG